MDDGTCGLISSSYEKFKKYTTIEGRISQGFYLFPLTKEGQFVKMIDSKKC
jgi:hypothetical protein